MSLHGESGPNGQLLLQNTAWSDDKIDHFSFLNSNGTATILLEIEKSNTSNLGYLR